jgi:Protein of unknown function (DUF1549)/Protein of unknown function (DUF1553)
MVSPTKAAGLLSTGVFLAGMVAFTPGGAALAGDLPRKEAAGPLDALALAQLIDQAIQERLSEDRATPAPPADDAEFLRRAYLDITGVIPPADTVSAFLDNTQPDKRARLIDELLASPNYGRHMGDVWQELLMAQRDLLTKGLQLEPLANWFAQGFNTNKAWDRQVTELLTSTGTQEQNGATTFFLAHRSPDRLNDTVCRVLLGIQLQCAQCHNHPFTSWKRTEYWGMAAFFAKVDDGAPKKLFKGATPNVVEASAVQKKRLPDSALETPPKFLEGEAPPLNAKEPYRPVLARWLTSADNPYFAKAMVNRVWAQFFGRGLVNPVDNLSADNSPSHPELFEALTQQFIRSGFDLKYLVRAICNSQAYQRSSTPTGKATGGDALYASMTIKPMTPQQLYDSLATFLGTSDRPKQPGGKAKGSGAAPRAAFVDFFRPAEGADPNEYPAGIPQVLRLMNSESTARTSAFVTQTLKSGQPPARNLEALFLATLSRRPTAAETRRMGEYLQANDSSPVKAYGDIFWALLNSSEFRLNH